MEFFDYNTIGKTDEEIMQMAKDFEEGNDCMIQYFWACELYLRLAEKGNEEAIERLVTRCARSLWLQDHFTVSESWFNFVKEKWEKRIEQDDKESCRLLAFCYIDGFAGEVDDEKAINLLQKAVSLNDYRSLNALGWMIDRERFNDGKTADDYYREAAEKDIAVAMVNLVWDESDIHKKLYWLEKAAGFNYSGAYYKLGQLYEDENFNKNDKIKAFEYYKKASKLGEYRAYKKMAEAYRYGKGVDVDINLAMYWYCMHCDIDTKDNHIDDDIYDYAKQNKEEIKKEVLEKFFVIAFRYNSVLPYDYFTKIRNEWNLRLYNDNRHWFRDYKRIPIIVFCTYINTVFFGDVDEDKDKELDKCAIPWLEKGDLIADGATICFQCEAIEADFIESIPNKDSLIIEKLKQAVELGFTKAMYVLGTKYWKGEYVVQDKTKALELIEAASVDYGPARLFMGNQYFYGNEILEKNFDLAIEYWSMPKMNNESHMKEESYDECTNNLIVVYNSIPNKMNKVKAHFLMDKIKNLSDSVTIKYNLAWMYQFGEGNYQQDIEKALELYDNNETKKDQLATTRAIYNRASIYFRRGDYDAGVKTFLKSNLSSQSYFQAIYLSTYFFYCGYYKNSEKLLCKNTAIFHLSMRSLYKQRKEYPFFAHIFFTRIMRLLINHGKYGNQLYRKININGLNRILKKLGDIPLQLVPEDEIRDSSLWNNKKTNIIDKHKQQIYLLENYIATINDNEDRKEVYYENILNWFKNNRAIIDSPIMLQYWDNKVKIALDSKKERPFYIESLDDLFED